MNPITVMVNGLPGNMAATVATHIVNDNRFRLVPFSLTGPEIPFQKYKLMNVSITLIYPEDRDNSIDGIIGDYPDMVMVDYTHPSSVNSNAAFYAAHCIPFVMGTTGGDRKQIEDTVCASRTSAVISPNMAKQIVGFQAMMAYAAASFPGLFEGYSLQVRESHQKGKADTSGTAKAIVRYFNQMGILFSEKDIQMQRDPEIQKNEWRIPEEYLDGHGWHTYTLISKDQTVKFEFCHNVNGRDVYALCTLDALLYLHKKIKQGIEGKVFSMIDVLNNV